MKIDRRARFVVGLSGVLLNIALVSTCGAADALSQDAPEAAQAPVGLTAGDWLVRGRVIGLFPIDEKSDVPLIGGRIHTPRLVLPDVDVSYFLTDHIALSGQVGLVRTQPRLEETLIGSFDIGKIWSAAATGTVQYHALPGAAVNPYAGVGISHSRAISTEPSPGLSDFDVRPITSFVLEAGVDAHLSGNFFGNIGGKYMFLPEQVYSGGGASFTSDMDMLVVGTGIGYRF